MNKSQLVERLAERIKVNKKVAQRIVSLVFDSFTQALLNDERIELRGFGILFTKKHSPYQWKNPKTGECIHVEEKRVPSFKTGKELKLRINHKEKCP